MGLAALDPPYKITDLVHKGLLRPQLRMTARTIMNPTRKSERNEAFFPSCPYRPLGLALFLAASVGTSLYGEPAELVPKPAKVEWTTGTATLDADTQILYGGDAVKAEAEMLAAMLRPATGLPLGVKPIVLGKGVLGKQLGNAIILGLEGNVESAPGKEGYWLDAYPGSVFITAPTPAGLFYGGQTLRQLLPPAVFAKTKQEMSSVVVHGGTEKQERNGVTYLPWHAIQDYSWVE